MSSLGALPQTLNSITATKIRELSKQRKLFDKRKHDILEMPILRLICLLESALF